MDLKDWLSDFLKDKRHVASLGPSGMFAVNSIERYIDQKNCVWELAITYTGRLVVHSGGLATDGVTVNWSEWTTIHHVNVPRELRDVDLKM